MEVGRVHRATQCGARVAPLRKDDVESKWQIGLAKLQEKTGCKVPL